ncbi:hypothetical protein HYU92_01280 [Candidatus Curtissbacteria bacterium]|nr:hypothetical protein [Candidatus Curtissbacteria bacterium]
MRAIFFTIAIILLSVGSILFLRTTPNPLAPSSSPILAFSPSSSPEIQEVNIEASFQINTNGIIRNFKSPKYHQRSPDVYLSADSPTIVHVKKDGITWDDFFKTLPMKLTKDCLTTGDGETFCNGSSSSLKFYLNGREEPDLLDKKIEDEDSILITFQQ